MIARQPNFPCLFTGCLRIAVLLAGGLIVLTNPAGAAIFVVDPNDSTFTIQDAIDAASFGDTVRLAPGNHFYWQTSGEVNGWSTRAVAFLKDGITIDSQAGPEMTIVDCSGPPAIRHGFVGENLSSATVIRGLTFNACEDVGFAGNGKWGGGLLLYHSSVLVENCRFVDCRADGGGAVFLYGGAGATIRDCIFVSNEAAEFGGAIETYLSLDTSIEGCTFARNVAGEGGGAILINSATADLTRCILWQNRSDTVGPGIMCLPGGQVSGDCNLFWENIKPADPDGTGSGSQATEPVRDCSTFGEFFVGDPLFCDPDGDDLMLMTGSPALPLGNSCGLLLGALEQGCGPISIESVSWGAIKALYR